MGAWPICMSESDEQRRYPGWSPCTMGSWVLTPRASVATTAGRMKRRASVREHKSGRGLMRHSFYFVTGLCEEVKRLLQRHRKWTWADRHSDFETKRDQKCPWCHTLHPHRQNVSRRLLRYSCEILFWWGKRCRRWERIYVLISGIYIYIYRSVYMNKEQASHWQGNRGLE